MKTVNLTALVLVLTGCAAVARSPERYRDDAKALLETRNADIRACYNAVLATAPGAVGKVTVTFDIETTEGKIVNVAIDAPNTTAPLPVAECVKKSIYGARMSPPDRRTGQASFAYDFTAP